MDLGSSKLPSLGVSERAGKLLWGEFLPSQDIWTRLHQEVPLPPTNLRENQVPAKFQIIQIIITTDFYGVEGEKVTNCTLIYIYGINSEKAT